LYDEAVAAHERYKKDEFLTAVYVYTSLRTGRLEAAVVIKNLAALWMYHGNPEKAFDLIPGISDPETAFKVAFFAGRYAKAHDFLKSLDLENPEVKLMQADLQWFSFDKTEARKTNSEIITNYQKFSWIPYHNLGWLMEGEKQIALFSEGVSCFPENEDLFRALVMALYEQGQVDEAERLMRDRVNYQGHDPLLTLLLREKLRGDETFKMFLWTIISDYPGIPWLSRYLGVYLLGRRDFDSLEFLLSRHDEDDKQVWVPFLTAIVEASRGNAGEGDGGFIRSIALEEKWEAVANRGIIALASRKDHEAYEHFHKALSMVPEDNGKNRSKIHFLMAKTLNRQGLTEDALEELFLSLVDDPLNQQAILLQKQLDDRY
jgi:tetratricopeptide (TPR) repeat protein